MRASRRIALIAALADPEYEEGAQREHEQSREQYDPEFRLTYHSPTILVYIASIVKRGAGWYNYRLDFMEVYPCRISLNSLHI